jgi:hypothetical protein
MPGTYGYAAPSLSGDLLTIHQLLQSPARITRRLRTYQDLRFISDRILTNRFRTSGGAVLYEQSESQLTDRAVEAIAPGSVYPKANLPSVSAALASVSKWGQSVDLTDEEVERSFYAVQSLDRALRKTVNTIIKQVDTITLSAIASAVTATQAASAAWNTATPKILLDILNAQATIVGLNLGYKPDTVLLNDAKYALLMSDQTITNMLRRENSTNPVYTGQIDMLAGLAIIVSPNLPTSDPWVLDSSQLGGMADERDAAPGYAVSDLGVEVQSVRVATADKWELQGRRKTVPVVQEPGAACRITGT